jgi:hypothetical protein
MSLELVNESVKKKLDDFPNVLKESDAESTRGNINMLKIINNNILQTCENLQDMIQTEMLDAAFLTNPRTNMSSDFHSCNYEKIDDDVIKYIVNIAGILTKYGSGYIPVYSCRNSDCNVEMDIREKLAMEIGEVKKKRKVIIYISCMKHHFDVVNVLCIRFIAKIELEKKDESHQMYAYIIQNGY